VNARQDYLFLPRVCALDERLRSMVLTWVGIILLAGCIQAAEIIPPAPKAFFTDYAGVVKADTARQLNSLLEDFERQASSQIVVAVYPKMQSDSSIEDYTFRVAESWKVGQKGKNNGAVLFVFIQDRALFIQVGYGLEGALPDALAKQIIENDIKPQFRNGDYGAGLSAGVNAILAATRGEYRGTGRTAGESGGRKVVAPGLVFLILVIVIVLFRVFASTNRVYRRRGYISTGGGWGGGWGGGSWGGGGGGGGGGFSGGGGSFGGGGAGGQW
jgi:uncharacterized protein